jgi:hypothetical protein
LVIHNSESRGCVMDDLVPDPTGLPALCPADEFEDVVAQIVAESLPRLFAVVQEYGTRVGVKVAGWGLVHDDGVDVIDIAGGVHLRVPQPEDVLRDFTVRNRITARIAWPGRHEFLA